MTKQQEKFYLICEILKKKFGWASISYNGVEKKEAFLAVGDKLYSIGLSNCGCGLTLSHGNKTRSIDMLCENNMTEEYTLLQCEKIDSKCRSIVDLSL